MLNILLLILFYYLLVDALTKNKRILLIKLQYFELLELSEQELQPSQQQQQ